MSSGKSAVGAVNVQRKTWDKEKFAARAKDRADGIVVEEEKAGPAPYRAAPSGLAGPAGSERAYLPSREVDLKLDEKLGKKRLVTDATPMSQVGGYFCDLCQCTLRDSTTYLNHINGVRHQRRMGFTMRVERSSVDAVKSRFAALKAQASGGSGSTVASTGTKKGGGVTLDAEDRYALAAMDHPDIAVVDAGSGPSLPLPAMAGSSALGSGPPLAGGKRLREGGGADARDGSETQAAPPSTTGDHEDESDELAAVLGFSGFGGSKRH